MSEDCLTIEMRDPLDNLEDSFLSSIIHNMIGMLSLDKITKSPIPGPEFWYKYLKCLHKRSNSSVKTASFMCACVMGVQLHMCVHMCVGQRWLTSDVGLHWPPSTFLSHDLSLDLKLTDSS